MKILVTGHNGFIGQNMVKSLNLDGHSVSTYSWGETFPVEEEFDQVIHLGAISSTAETDVDKIMIQNYEFTMMLFNWCDDRNTRLQYASSCSVYGNTIDFRESAKLDPKTPYAWSKYLVDRHLASRPSRAHTQGFRYTNVFGPHEDHKDQPSPHSKFEKQAIETGTITVFEGSESMFRDFVSVERVIEIHKRFFNISETGVWNVGSGESRSFLDVAKEIAAKYDAKIEVVPMPDSMKANYQYYTKADLTKLNKSLSKVWL